MEKNGSILFPNQLNLLRVMCRDQKRKEVKRKEKVG